MWTSFSSWIESRKSPTCDTLLHCCCSFSPKANMKRKETSLGKESRSVVKNEAGHLSPRSKAVRRVQSICCFQAKQWEADKSYIEDCMLNSFNGEIVSPSWKSKFIGPFPLHSMPRFLKTSLTGVNEYDISPPTSRCKTRKFLAWVRTSFKSGNSDILKGYPSVSARYFKLYSCGLPSRLISGSVHFFPWSVRLVLTTERWAWGQYLWKVVRTCLGIGASAFQLDMIQSELLSASATART